MIKRASMVLYGFNGLSAAKFKKNGCQKFQDAAGNSKMAAGTLKMPFLILKHREI